MKIDLSFAFFISLLITSCFSCSSERQEFITDKDIVINNRFFSSDGSKLVLIYQYDAGALGYTGREVAILNSKDSLLNLVNYKVENSDFYGHHMRWVGNDLIQIERDTLVVSDCFSNRHDTLINGIRIKYIKE